MGKNIISQRRGRGTTSFRAPSFKFKGMVKIPNVVESAVVVDIQHCAGHSAPLVVLELSNGSVAITVAPENTVIGSQIEIGTTVVSKGNVLALKDMPEGTLVHNIELKPGDGGKLVRASGGSARVGPRVPTGISLILPSKRVKIFNDSCRATVGVVAGGGRLEKPLLKAGNMHYKQKARNHLYPVVSGSAMNAVAHPLGNKRTARKSKNKPVSRDAPPGRKVGNVAARRTGQQKGKKK